MLRFQVKAACDVEMKIHERIVSYFESCTSQVDKEGFLHKKVGKCNNPVVLLAFSIIYKSELSYYHPAFKTKLQTAMHKNM